MDCVGSLSVFCGLYVCMVAFSKFVDCKRGREMGFVVGGLGGRVSEFAGNFLVLAIIEDWEEGWDGKGGIGFYMCLCCC